MAEHTPGPCQLVAYLLSNIDDLTESFGCTEADLKKPLALLNAAPELLEALKGDAVNEALWELDRPVRDIERVRKLLRYKQALIQAAIAMAEKGE